MARNYYYLVAGLKEYQPDSETKGFDAVAVRDGIAAQLQAEDAGFLRDFYAFYDIVNLIALLQGKERFDRLGNFTREELREELESQQMLRFPEYIRSVLLAYRNRTKEDKYNEIDETVDTELPQERNLWMRYYRYCEGSKCAFIRKWYGFDRDLRNIAAAYTARRQKRGIAPELIGDDGGTGALVRSSALDFGLKEEVDYIDRLIQILETPDMVEKERKLDLLRWEKADGFTDFDYFNINRILAYCAKIDIIQRWLTLDPKTGEAMFRRLLSELTGREIVDGAVRRAEREAEENKRRIG